MHGNNWLRIAVTAALLLAVGIACFVLPAAADEHYGEKYFTNLPLTTQDGKIIHFYDDLLKGKIVAINLIYTHCEYSCPLETARLAQVQQILGDRLGKDIFFYSITIDPKRDTPQVLKAYAEKFHAGPGWTFLTGKKEDIDLISRRLGLWSPPAQNKDGHTPHLLIGNEASGQWMRDSANDNPRFLANLIGNFIDNWRHAATAPPKRSYAEATPLHLDAGAYLFSKQCAACHTIGMGDKIGPDLSGVTLTRDHDWLVRYIREPEKVLAEKDPVATALFEKYKQVRMPKLPIGNEDMAALIKFLESQDRKMTAGGVVGGAKTQPATEPEKLSK
ncbi:MAG TPA: SCO family protein [Terriglobales bacterium]|nr:SCO family protein [Terriglobales bacterium]